MDDLTTETCGLSDHFVSDLTIRYMKGQPVTECISFISVDASMGVGPIASCTYLAFPLLICRLRSHHFQLDSHTSVESQVLGAFKASDDAEMIAYKPQAYLFCKLDIHG